MPQRFNRATGDLYFATDNFVWAANDDGASITNSFAGGLLHVGTEAGVFYAVEAPFP